MKATKVALTEIGVEATKAEHLKLDKEDEGGIAKADISKISESADATCDYCEHGKCTLGRILWYCRFS